MSSRTSAALSTVDSPASATEARTVRAWQRTVGATRLRLDNQLCFALYSTSLAMTRVYKRLLAPLGLTYPQYVVLLVLWEHDGQGVGELGERLFLDSGTLTPLLKRMESIGLLQRARATDDERRVIVRLTDAGSALRHEARSVPRDLAAAVPCGEAELAGLTRRLQDLRTLLHEGAAALSV